MKTAEEIIKLGQKLRTAQKQYFKGDKRPSHLQHCRDLERKLDQDIEEYLNRKQTNMFDPQSGGIDHELVVDINGNKFTALEFGGSDQGKLVLEIPIGNNISLSNTETGDKVTLYNEKKI